MKKVLAVALTLVLVAGFAFAGGANETQTKAKDVKKVALITSPGGTDSFILNMQDGMKELAAERGFEAQIIECSDLSAFEDNMRAAIMEGCDLLVGGGWEANSGISKLAEEFKGECSFILIDDISSSDNVASVSFRETESMYLVGMVAALVTEPEDMIFGSINVNQGAGSWKWRYGYQEGIRAIKPEAKVIFNYTGSYNDPAKAKEFSLQMYAQGCRYIAACCSACGDGIREAALEKHFYTDDSDVDRTTPDNPYVATSMIKDTKTVVKLMVGEWLDKGENWKPENKVLGVKDGALGAVYVNYESMTDAPRPATLTDEDVAIILETLKKMQSGEIMFDSTTMPTEEEYNATHKN